MTKYLFILTFILTAKVHAQDFTIGATNVNVSVLTTDVNIPWDISWGPDHMIWMTDGPTVKKMDPKTGKSKVIWTSPRKKDGFPIGNGLGLTFHPDFFNTPQVFMVLDTGFYYQSNSLVKVYRYDYSFTEDTLTNETFLFEYKTSGEHCGARMLTTNDGKIMVTTPDYWYNLPPSSLQGRTLRFNPDGSVPSDNPFGNYTYSLGHRNPQGILQLPNGKIYVSEHGQWTRGQDELNLIVPGGNYGWPAYDGFECSFISPDSCNSSTFQSIAPIDGGNHPPSGIDYYNHPAIPEFSNSILEATLNNSAFIVFNLNSNGDAVNTKTSYFQSQFGRLRDVCTSPSGEIFIITNDRTNLATWERPVNSDAKIRVIKNKNYNHCTPTSAVLHHEICSGDSVLINGNYYKSAQNITETKANAAGCDSLIIHVIDVYPSYNFTNPDVSICDGDSALIFGAFQKTSGTYQQAFQTVQGCDSVYNQKLIVKTINVNILQTNGELQAETIAPNYQWLECSNMDAIANANNQTFTPQNSGSYAVEITKDGCVDTSNCEVVIITSADAAGKAEAILIYPNPTNGIVTFSKAMSYEVYSYWGKFVTKGRGNFTDLSDLPKGVYVMKCENQYFNIILK